MNPAIAGRIPLVCRPKPPGTALATRIAAVTELTTEPGGADRHQRIARASGVLNFAALIASDSGIPDLATELCWRQYTIFAEAGSLDQDTAVMALMPLVNIARLLIREGDGNGAYELLQRLYRAAQQCGKAVIRDHETDLSPWIRTDADHRRLCTELWVTVLVDGARALARSGRWIEAAEAMASHCGIGNRLLDGRQIMIMSLIEQGKPLHASAMIDSTVPAEPWENTVAAMLRICCQPDSSPIPPGELDHTAREALALIAQCEPMTAAFCVRVGLTALDLAAGRPTRFDRRLRAALHEVASADAYAARDTLDDQVMRSQMTRQQEHELLAVLTASGLGTGSLPAAELDSLTTAVRTAEGQLRTLLAATAR
jgi:hypothetical protein